MSAAHRIRLLFDRAHALPPSERAAFLDRKCGGDAALRAEVDSLLDVDDRGFLSGPPSAVTLGGLPVEELPSAFGPYELVERLGRGGMGVVFRARHRTTGTVVALKTVDTSHSGMLEAIRREVHALARLSHPAIVRILDEGLSSEKPWYAMELLEGETLARHVRRLVAPLLFFDGGVMGGAEIADPPRASWWTSSFLFQDTTPLAGPVHSGVPGPPGRPGGGLPAGGGRLPEMLTLVRRLCVPLAFLHGEGIVHRDLKPENVLVDPRGRPVLLDFGLVGSAPGALSREGLHADPTGLGTAAYIAPEQGLGELVDARADLYALGCILYELCTGRPPFVGATPVATLQRRYHEEPRPPSHLVEGIPAGLDALVMRLLSRDPRERLGYADDVAAALVELGARDEGDEAPASSTPRPYLYRPRLTGRESTVATLTSSLDRARHGQPTVALVGGHSGSGKTRLLLHVAGLAKSFAVDVQSGGCAPGVTGGGAGPSQALRAVLAALADRAREGSIPGLRDLFARHAATLALYDATIVPGKTPEEDGTSSTGEGSQRICRAVAACWQAMARHRPVAILLDDIQWADDVTHALLAHLVRDPSLGAQDSRSKLLVVATYRTEEPGEWVEQLRRQAGGGARLTHQRLEPLGAPEVARIIGDMLAMDEPSPRLVELLTRQSEGNPFFVAEYLRAAVGEGLLGRDASGQWGVRGDATDYEGLGLPGSIQELVTRRIDAIPLAAQRALEAAAVLGPQADASLVAALSPAEVTDLETLRRREFLEEEASGALRFVHDRVREVAHAAIPAGRRATLHRAAAEQLESRGMGEREEDASMLGDHWREGRDPVKARACYLIAARRASPYSSSQAVRWYRAYLELGAEPSPESAWVRWQLARLVALLKGVPDAVAELDRALQDARAAGSLATEIDVLTEIGAMLTGTGELERADASLDAALELVRRGGTPRDEAIVQGARANVLRHRGEFDGAIALYTRAASLARSIPDPRLEAITSSNLATVHFLTAHFKEARELYERAIRTLEQEPRDRALLAKGLSNLGVLACAQGKMEESSELLSRAVEMHERMGNVRQEGIALGNLGMTLAERGIEEESGRAYGRCLELARQGEDRHNQSIALSGMGALALCRGDLELASKHCAEALEINDTLDDPHSRCYALSQLAEVRDAEGRGEEARRLAERAVEIGRGLRSRESEAVALRRLGRIERREGRLERASDCLARADAILREIEDPWERAKVVCEIGNLELAQGKSAAASLATARELERTLAAEPGSLVARAVRELERAVRESGTGRV